MIWKRKKIKIFNELWINLKVFLLLTDAIHKVIEYFERVKIDYNYFIKFIFGIEILKQIM